MTWAQMGWLKRALLILAAAGACCVFALFGFSFWIDLTATQVTFVNDSNHTVDLPDCSTDLVELPAHQTAQLPIGSDHPVQCTVEYLTGQDDTWSVACLAMPIQLVPKTTLRISEAKGIASAGSCPD